jgi:putative redox protein
MTIGHYTGEELTLITCYSKKTNFDTWFTNGKHEGNCDAPVAKGGTDSSFTPRELMEASLAGCLNIWIRMYAANHDIPLASIMTEVSLEQPTTGATTFQYALEFKGSLSEAQRQELARAAQDCPVH